MKLYVNVSTTISTDVVIEAPNKTKAEEIARNLAFDDDDFVSVIVDAFNSDYEAYRPKYWTFDAMYEAPDSEEAMNKSTNDKKWACPDCSTDEFGYVTDYVVLDKVDGGWQCPKCGCYTGFPEADACFDLSEEE